MLVLGIKSFRDSLLCEDDNTVSLRVRATLWVASSCSTPLLCNPCPETWCPLFRKLFVVCGLIVHNHDSEPICPQFGFSYLFFTTQVKHCLLCKACQMERVICEMVDHHEPYKLQTYGETILQNMPWRKRIILYLNLLYHNVLFQFTVYLITILKKKKKKSFEEEAFVWNSFHHFWLWMLFYGSHNSICLKKKE